MDFFNELHGRLAQRRAEKLGGLSPEAYTELLLAVQKDPQSFIDEPADEAFELLAKAVKCHEDSRRNDEFLDDDAFMQERTRRFALMREICGKALAIDPCCTDAQLLLALAEDAEPDRTLDLLLELSELIGQPTPVQGEDAWQNLFARPWMRVQACIARCCIDGARYRMAEQVAAELLEFSASDWLGARHTRMLALARLEDEEALDALDAQYGRHGDAWTQLARTILFYKLGRMSAARRALAGFDKLCEGGAYALLRPVMIDTYMPCRPDATPYSFEEATLAVHEADPIICDIPDFPSWAESQEEIAASAAHFAEQHGFMW